jgi:hypothetical protein
MANMPTLTIELSQPRRVRLHYHCSVNLVLPAATLNNGEGMVQFNTILTVDGTDANRMGQFIEDVCVP